MLDRQAETRPSIYYFHAALATSGGGGFARHLDRCREMGFSHVLLAPPFWPGRDGDIFAVADYDALNPALGIEQPALPFLNELVAQCRSRGLSAWLDIALDGFAPENALVDRTPHWFKDGGRDGLPDPRRISATQRTASLDFSAEAEGEIRLWWRDKLAALIKAGIEGFRLTRLQGVPAGFLKALIADMKAQHPHCRFIAWTPGLSPQQVDGLRECGLDWTVASTPWWDFRSEWYFDEAARLRAVAPTMALAEAPFGPRLAEHYASTDELDRGYRRALHYSATARDGWLMPMGFEYASALRLDPTRADPEAFDRETRTSNAPLISEIAQANAAGRKLVAAERSEWRPISAPGAPVLAETSIAVGADAAFLRLVNADGAAERVSIPGLLARTSEAWSLRSDEEGLHNGSVSLRPGEVRLLELVRAKPVKLATPQSRRQAAAAAKVPRVAILHIDPAVEGGAYPAKRIVGQAITVAADVFSDGHGELAVDLLWRASDESDWRRAPMRALGNDRWEADFHAERVGDHLFTVEAWRDDFASLQHGTLKKRDAGQQIELELTELTDFLERRLPSIEERGHALATFLQAFRGAKRADRTTLLLSKQASVALRDATPMESRVRHEPLPLTVDRAAALFSSWYELFPRSQSGSAERHGTFDDVIARLPAIEAMGFDTLYFPPIHPIGRVNRKGRNNSTTAEPNDPGSPYAIGSPEGGHDAIHPALGTLEDFLRLRDAASAHGLELALDFAIQCAPDHPWLKQHPEWFAWRPDGTIAYAENPPKKYEDIVNVDFYAPGAVPSLWLALRDVILHWRMQGVRTFRVDNPHTKPFAFWRWVIADIRARFPDTLFLAEAFTRPQVMYELAKLGFSQSYTYFTWRNTKAEIESYLTELTQEEPRDFFRPHFFVNTPDINPVFLQRSGRAGFLIRAALAATLSGLWGVYSGFELCEGAPLPGKEEYLDSEKYEIRAWDWQRPGNIVAEISQLNRIRRRNPALQTHLGLEFQTAHNEHITFFSKATPERDSVILVAINLDPFHAQEAAVEMPLWQWGLPDHAAVEIEDLIGGNRFWWHGKHGTIRLDPYALPYFIWRVHLPRINP